MPLLCIAIFSIHSSAPPPIATISPPGETPTAGESFSLNCSVTLEDGGSLTDSVTVHWEAPIDIDTDINTQVMTTDFTVTHTSILKFTPIRTLHRGKYNCKAASNGGTDMATETLTVQSKKRSVCLSLV